MAIKYTDVRPSFEGSSMHVCPNECLIMLRSLLNDLPPLMAKGGSIASGGEVPLTVVLPRVEHLKIIDHNYGSLWWTCNKILMIKHRTNEQIKALFEGPPTDFVKLMNDIQGENPLSGRGFNLNYRVADQYWLHEITPRELDIARERLDQIEVIHGDLRDLGTNLDLLYISNALEHTSFDGKSGDRSNLATTVKSVVSYRGHIIGTGPEPAGCHQHQRVTESCAHARSHLTWNYFRVQPKLEPRHRYERNVAQRRLMHKYVDHYSYYRQEILKPIALPALYNRAFTQAKQELLEQRQYRTGAIR